MTELPALSPLDGTPLVSVLIVNYNYGRFLPEAIESVLGQTYQRFEIVICDDGSQDDSRAVIEGYAAKDERIKFIFKANAGMAAALNDAYAQAVGAIVSLLDSDDFFAPQKLERVVEKLLPGGRVGIVLNRLAKIDSAGAQIGAVPQFGTFDRGELRDYLLSSAAHWSVAPTSGISIRRECAERIFPIPEGQFRTEADAYISTVAPLYYAVDVLDEPLASYRVHSSNLTASRSVDVKWCEKIISAAQRVFAVLRSKAAEHGWKVTQLEDNPVYCEMVVIRDYLSGRALSVRYRNIRQLFRATRKVQTADASKVKTKGLMITVASFLPERLGRRLLESIYLSSGLKTRSAALLTALRPS